MSAGLEKSWIRLIYSLCVMNIYNNTSVDQYMGIITWLTFGYVGCQSIPDLTAHSDMFAPDMSGVVYD